MCTGLSLTAANAYFPLRWRHNGSDSVSNHHPHDCLLNSLFGRRSKKTSKFRVTGLCEGNSPGPVNSPHKWPVTRKLFPFDDVTMGSFCLTNHYQTQIVAIYLVTPDVEPYWSGKHMVHLFIRIWHKGIYVPGWLTFNSVHRIWTVRHWSDGDNADNCTFLYSYVKWC